MKNSSFFYYVAIPLNFILRSAWVVSVIPSSVFNDIVHLNSASYSLVDVLYPFLAIVEQVRRTIWGILKLEYEHIVASDKTAFSQLLKDLSAPPTIVEKPIAEITSVQAFEIEDKDPEAQQVTVEPLAVVSPKIKNKLVELSKKRRKNVYIPYSLHDGALSEQKQNVEKSNTSITSSKPPENRAYNLKAACFHGIFGVLLVLVALVFLLIQ